MRPFRKRGGVSLPGKTAVELIITAVVLIGLFLFGSFIYKSIFVTHDEEIAISNFESLVETIKQLLPDGQAEIVLQLPEEFAIFDTKPNMHSFQIDNPSECNTEDCLCLFKGYTEKIECVYDFSAANQQTATFDFHMAHFDMGWAFTDYVKIVLPKSYKFPFLKFTVRKIAKDVLICPDECSKPLSYCRCYQDYDAVKSSPMLENLKQAVEKCGKNMKMDAKLEEELNKELGTIFELGGTLEDKYNIVAKTDKARLVPTAVLEETASPDSYLNWNYDDLAEDDISALWGSRGRYEHTVMFCSQLNDRELLNLEGDYRTALMQPEGEDYFYVVDAGYCFDGTAKAYVSSMDIFEQIAEKGTYCTPDECVEGEAESLSQQELVRQRLKRYIRTVKIENIGGRHYITKSKHFFVGALEGDEFSDYFLFLDRNKGDEALSSLDGEDIVVFNPSLYFFDNGGAENIVLLADMKETVELTKEEEQRLSNYVAKTILKPLIEERAREGKPVCEEKIENVLKTNFADKHFTLNVVGSKAGINFGAFIYSEHTKELLHPIYCAITESIDPLGRKITDTNLDQHEIVVYPQYDVSVVDLGIGELCLKTAKPSE